MPEEMEFENMEKDFELREALKIPGALASLIMVAILSPRLGLISSTMGGLIEQIFSLPLIFVFIIEVVLNKNIDIKKNVGILLILSYLLFVFKNSDKFIGKFLELNWLFLVSVVVAFTIILIYYTFHRLVPKIENMIPGRQGLSKRFLFIFVFIPTVILSMVCLYLFKYVGVYEITKITELIKSLAMGV